MAAAFEPTARRTVGVRDIPVVLVAPRRLFRRVEDVGAYGWPLTILLTAVTLIGFATVETGLIGLEVDRRVAERIAAIESEQRDVIERSALRELYAQAAKVGEFEKLLLRIGVVAAEPLRALGAVLLIAAVLYGAVALTGRKVEWHTLLTICVYASFIDVLRLLMKLTLMLRHGSLDVHTSLSPLVRMVTDTESARGIEAAAWSGLLSAVDPFVIWFWLVVIVGLATTAQLRGWRAWGTCALCWLAGAGLRCGLTVAAAHA